MWNDIDARLQSDEHYVRMEAWNWIHEKFTDDHASIAPARLQRWADILFQEEDDDIARCGQGVMICLLAKERGKKRSAVKSLGDYLMAPFKRSSVVLRISDPQRRRRDEGALFVLGQRLPLRDYPHVTPHSIPLDAPEWGTIVNLNPHAIFLMGRLGLYGPEAMRWWSPKNPRIRFPTCGRNPAIPLDELDPAYHGLWERLPDGSDLWYQARDEGGAEGIKKRKDYALVERHVANYGPTQVVVVNCAGTSSLGTLGAVMWAASYLSRDPIELPQALKQEDRPDSRVEALLEVTADITNNDWAPTHIELLKLYADEFAWSKETQWVIPAPSYVQVLLEDGQPDRPLAVLLDGNVANMEPTSEIFRLAVRLAQRWVQGGHNPVSLQELANDPWIWAGRAARPRQVRQRLNQLRSRYLHESVAVVDHQHVRLLANVAIEAISGLQAADGMESPPPEPTRPLAAGGAAKPKRNPR